MFDVSAGVNFASDNQPPKSASTKSLTTGRRSGPWVARALAIAVLVLASYLQLSDDGCDSTTTTMLPADSVGSPTPSGQNESTVVRVCSGLDAADLAPLFAIAGLLLLGELNELSIAGILSLKRRIGDQEQAIASQRESLNVLSQQIHDIRLNVAQSASAKNDTFIYMNPVAAAEEARERIRRTEEGIKTAAGSARDIATDGLEDAERKEKSPEELRDRGPNVEQAPGDQSASQLSISDEAKSALEDRTILTLYGRLEPFLLVGQGDFASDRPRNQVTDLSAWQRTVVAQWFAKWNSEIKLVRSVRNAIANPPAQVTAEDRRGTIDLLLVLEADLSATMSEFEARVLQTDQDDGD